MMSLFVQELHPNPRRSVLIRADLSIYENYSCNVDRNLQ